MKFPWLRPGGKLLPLIRCGFRRKGVKNPPDLLLLMDTGADGVLLPLSWAGLLGLSATDLEPQQAMGLGGPTTTFTPRESVDVEISIGRFWFLLPTLTFSERCFPLLGRDVVFPNFEIRMSDSEVEFRRRMKSK